MRKISDISYGPHELQKLDLYLPDGESFDLFVYFHGGGFKDGDKARQSWIYEYLACHGIAAASVNYRMYPDAKYPDFIEDCASAVAFAREDAKKYGAVKKTFVGGSSAGGYASMLLCFNYELLGAHGISPEEMGGFFHDAGQPTSHFNVLVEKGYDNRRIIVDETAPLYYIEGGKNYPPMQFIVSDNDIPNRYEQTMLVLSTLKHFEYDESHISHKLMHSTHTAYRGWMEDGESVYGRMIAEFIDWCNKL